MSAVREPFAQRSPLAVRAGQEGGSQQGVLGLTRMSIMLPCREELYMFILKLLRVPFLVFYFPLLLCLFPLSFVPVLKACFLLPFHR